MTDQLTIVRAEALQQAIQTVIHDFRVPKELRTALAVYQKRRRDEDNLKIDTRWPERTERTCLPRTIQYSLGVASERGSPRNATHEGSCILNWPIAVEHEISVRHNDESLDWSVKINGRHHEHVTSEVMEALVECALIVAQMSSTRTLATRLQ